MAWIPVRKQRIFSNNSKATSKQRRQFNSTQRLNRFELLEDRYMLDASGFAGNDCPPDLDLSAVSNQTIAIGETLSFNIFDLGATVEDLDSLGEPTNDTIRLLLDPDVGTDTPVGATITEDGDFSWTPTLDQAGVHQLIVIAIDEGTPALADAELLTIEVTNDTPPEVDLNGDEAGIDSTATFTEDGGAVVIVDSDLTVTDSEDANLVSATASISNLLDGAAESLSVDTTGTSITANYDDTTGVLSLTGTDTLANYQLVLRTLSYNNSSQDPDVTDRTVEVVVNDGSVDSTTAVATVSVIPENDAPNLDLNGDSAGTGFEATFTENGGPVSIVDTDLFIEDVDDSDLASATVTITNLLDGTAELLAVDTTGTSIVANYDDTTGVLSLTGSDTLANYQQVLRTLTYDNSSDNPDETDRIIETTVNDGTDDSVARVSTVSVLSANDAPQLEVIADQDFIIGGEFSIIVTATDPENDNLTFTLDPDNSPTTATIEKTSDTTAIIRWTPDSITFPDSEIFRVLVTDDGSPTLSDSESFQVTVHEVNESPDLASIASQVATVDTEVIIEITASDPNTGQTLTFFLDPDNTPEGATLEQTSNTTATIRWTPTVDDTAEPVSFLVQVTDDGYEPLVDFEFFTITVEEAEAVVASSGVLEESVLDEVFEDYV